jgi:hypothetical protein
LPQYFWNIIEFDEPKTLEDAIQKARYCYEQLNHKEEHPKEWKKKSKMGFKKKGVKPSRFKNYGKGSRMSFPTKSVNQQNFPSQSGNKTFGSALGRTESTKKEPLKCWGCGEEHMLRDFPHRNPSSKGVYNIQEATMVDDVARSMPKIHAALDNRKADHQASVVEMEGMVTNHLISILIDPGSNLSYISPQTIEKCKLQQEKHAKPWLVQLATGTKRKVTKVITTCQIIMNGFPTQATLNILPLGSYDMLIGMDWLASHKSKMDCYNKTLECEDDKGKKRTLQGIQNLVSVRQISSLQMKKYCRKGCPLYAIQVLNSVEDQKPSLEDHPILKDYRDVFPEEVPGLPPRRDIDFSIELVPGAVPMSRAPYRMSTPELVELKL